VWEYFGTFFQPAWGMDEMHLRYIYGHWTDPQSRSVELAGFNGRYDNEAWHVYGFRWTAEAMVWTVDGSEVGRLVPGTGPNDVPAAAWPDEEFCLVMNNAVMASPPDQNTTWPNYLIIDYVALYQHAGG
jgi:beta-glucanase (GH16 family)